MASGWWQTAINLLWCFRLFRGATSLKKRKVSSLLRPQHLTFFYDYRLCSDFSRRPIIRGIHISKCTLANAILDHQFVAFEPQYGVIMRCLSDCNLTKTAIWALTTWQGTTLNSAIVLECLDVMLVKECDNITLIVLKKLQNIFCKDNWQYRLMNLC